MYVEHFVKIAEALGEKPGNLLPNDVGAIGHLKPIVDRLATVQPELLPHVMAILGKVVLLAERVVNAAPSLSVSRANRPVLRPKARA